MASLPSTRRLVTDIFASISKPGNRPAQANPLASFSSTDKSTFLTLHVLFPNELLPALDLLDRGLVTRLRISPLRSQEHQTAEANPAGEQANRSEAGTANFQSAPHPEASNVDGPSTYYVRSAQQPSTRGNSRFRHATYEQTTYYEVRLDAWNCSCPAFVFSAFPAVAPPPRANEDAEPQDQSRHDWCFGGLTIGTDMPVCKHILACALVEHTAMFAHFRDDRTVSLEEAAGWAAGWGD